MFDELSRPPTRLFARFYPEEQDREVAGCATVRLSPSGLMLIFPDETVVHLPLQVLADIYISWNEQRALLPGASFAAILLPGQGHLVLVGEAPAVLFGILSRQVAHHEASLPAARMEEPAEAPETSKPLNHLYVLGGCLVIIRADGSRALYSRDETRVMYETLRAYGEALSEKEGVAIQTPASFHTRGFFQFKGKQALSLLRLLQGSYQGA